MCSVPGPTLDAGRLARGITHTASSRDVQSQEGAEQAFRTECGNGWAGGKCRSWTEVSEGAQGHLECFLEEVA